MRMAAEDAKGNENGAKGSDQTTETLVTGLASQSLWTLEMSLRGGRQPTWQPLSPHQDVADCNAHPGDHSMLRMNSNKLIKAIIAQMVCALFNSKAVRALHLVAAMQEME